MTGALGIAALIILASYVLGSIPFGYLIAKSQGVDIRKHGSGNIGATNVFRTLGRKWGALVFLLDACKGFAAIPLAVWLNHSFPEMMLGDNATSGHILAFPPVLAKILAAIWVIVGHNFPVWLGFKGGKGVATSAGVMLALLPLCILVALVVWVILFYSTRYVSIASIAAALALPATVCFLSSPEDRWPLFCLTLVIAFLVIWRHRANIGRLMAGTEHRFEKKPKPAP